MNNEEKILEMLEKLTQTVENQGSILEKHGEMLEKHGEMLEKHGEMLEKLQTDVSGIKIRLDADIQKQLDILQEGDEALADRLERMDRRLERVEELAEDSKDKLDVVYYVVKQHGAEITELKKAQ